MIAIFTHLIAFGLGGLLALGGITFARWVRW